MGKHWVKALSPISRYDMDGAYRTYYPGDWFECKNQELLELLARRAVETNAQIIKREFDPQDCGVLVLNDAVVPAKLDYYGVGVQQSEIPELHWERTMILGQEGITTAESIILGLMRVADDGEYPAWEMAAMLKNFNMLAGDIGTAIDKARTLELVGDLRIPVYDPDLVWIRRTETTKEIVKFWCDELQSGADPRHAFLRAIYSQGVALCTLPANWIGRWIKE